MHTPDMIISPKISRMLNPIPMVRKLNMTRIYTMTAIMMIGRIYIFMSTF